MIVLYPNLCYNQLSYKKIALYIYMQAPTQECVIKRQFSSFSTKYLKEPSQWDGSFEHTKQMFKTDV